jgi:hypothetical protein
MSNDVRINQLLSRWQDLQDQGQITSLEELTADCPELLEQLRGKLLASGKTTSPTQRGQQPSANPPHVRAAP